MIDYKQHQTDLFAVAETVKKTETNGFKIISYTYIQKSKNRNCIYKYRTLLLNRQPHDKFRLRSSGSLLEPKAKTVRKYV